MDPGDVPDTPVAEAVLGNNGMKAPYREFLIKWVGKPESEATWEQEAHVQHMDVVIAYLNGGRKRGRPKNPPSDASLGSAAGSGGSTTASGKKRGRPKKKARVEEEEEAEAEDAGEADEEYVISQVLQIRGKPPNLEFLIRWEGYGPEHDSWEPESGIGHLEIIKDARAWYTVMEQKQKVVAKGGSALRKPLKPPKAEAVARLRAAIQSLTKSQISSAPGDFVPVRLEVDDDTDVAELIGAFFGTVADQKARQAAMHIKPKTIAPKIITSTVKSQKVLLQQQQQKPKVALLTYPVREKSLTEKLAEIKKAASTDTAPSTSVDGEVNAAASASGTVTILDRVPTDTTEASATETSVVEPTTTDETMPEERGGNEEVPQSAREQSPELFES
ncbi:hypothetical protein RvY_10836-2 [Ramazzottius varieornatus]|uniref:Chromo domain-containing protein n=1 Tax=Ramazzottius varieornatus TaxID=947166 RepID=A0A1D1VG51_RAMVA|nr:hypothetical protein RvY_10836-2 [Ramazzottius varieornatus]